MPTAIPMSGADAPVIRLARCQRMMIGDAPLDHQATLAVVAASAVAAASATVATLSR